jgi:hypothetical protein
MNVNVSVNSAIPKYKAGIPTAWSNVYYFFYYYDTGVNIAYGLSIYKLYVNYFLAIPKFSIVPIQDKTFFTPIP